MKKKSNDPQTGIKRDESSERKNELEAGNIIQPDKQHDGDFPGYPHYPASEDILNHSMQVEVIDNTKPDDAKDSMEKPALPEMQESDEQLPKSEADLTSDDLLALGPKEINNDLGDDEILKRRVYPVDMAGEDLDVPGSELDDTNEEIGEEDEENNTYSLGGDRHED